MIHLLQRLLHLRLGHAVRLFVQIDFLLADCPGGFLHFERTIPIGLRAIQFRLAGLQRRDVGPQHGNLVVHVFDRMLQFESIGPRLGHHRAHFVLRHQQICLRRGDHRFFQIDIDLKRLLVELNENVPLLHPVVVVDQNLHHLARHTRGDEGDVTVDVGIVGRNGVERQIDHRNAEINRQRHRADGKHSEDDAFDWESPRRGRRGRLRCGNSGCG